MCIRKLGGDRRGGTRAFTLVEAVMAVAVAAVAFGMIVLCYIQATRRAEWSGYSLAAQSLAIQQLEQARSAVWDPVLGKNEITNLNLSGWSYDGGTRTGRGYSWGTLDLPIAGTNVMTATNFVTVQMIYLNNTMNPPVQVHMVRVDTVWNYSAGRIKRPCTNTVCTYLAPDNRDAKTL
jgi:type II secretory pathway pseudopilin PulG